jgi:hypothetical protein
MLLYESWSRKGVEVKCIHKHEEGTKRHGRGWWRLREGRKTYKEYGREREREREKECVCNQVEEG